jgi:hypothetical protein
MQVGTAHYTRYRFSSFSFPFAGFRQFEIYPYEIGGIFFSAPPLLQPPLTAVSLQQLAPLIAPFLLPRAPAMPPTVDLFVRETADDLLLTWRVPADLYTGSLSFDVQARLKRDGGMVFSYRATGAITWPSVAVISTGSLPPPPTFPPGPPAPPASIPDLDLSQANGLFTLPIAEIFSVAMLDPALVWKRLQSDFGYRDDQIDGVAIYQDFNTDIVYYAAAYCIYGNSGADGVMNRSAADDLRMGTRFPLRPSLMHMGNIETTSVGSPNTWLFMHEFAHRWLYHFDYSVDGVTKHQNGHPSSFTNTAAAFPQPGANATYSPIGGSSWDDQRNGTFRTIWCNGERGYSWHELYLMGLAGPEEVPSWFYLDDATYVSGTTPPTCTSSYTSSSRHDLSVDNIRQATGARVPGVADSKKAFNVVLVLLTRNPDAIAGDTVKRMLELRAAAPAAFARATGGRGQISMLPPGPPRRRAVGR